MVLGVLPALDATRCLLSVEAPAAVGSSLLSLNPVEVGEMLTRIWEDMHATTCYLLPFLLHLTYRECPRSH